MHIQPMTAVRVQYLLLMIQIPYASLLPVAYAISFCAQGIERTGMRIRPMNAVYRAFDSYKRDYKARLLHSCDKIDMD